MSYFHSIWPLAIGFLCAWLIPMLYAFIPYSRVRQVLKWIKIMAKKLSENNTIK
jgi:hypothetical protein